MDDRSPTRGIARGLTNYGDPAFALYLRRSFARSMGYSDAMLDRPVVGIAYTASGFNNCHRHFPEMLAAVKRGVLAAGALPIEFPTISLGEVFLSPTSLKFRNLMALDTEAMIRAQPMDAVVLMGGCDKTVPAQLMAAASADLPAIQLVAGPMSTSRHRGERLGACTDCRRFWARYRAADIDAAEIEQVEGRLATTAGTCAVMGTASTMACIAEALGMALPGSAAIPAVHADRLRAAEATGARAAAMIGGDLTPSRIVTAASIEQRAPRAPCHRRLDQRASSISRPSPAGAASGSISGASTSSRTTTPVLVNLKPVGQHYMEDLFAAGGVDAVLRELAPLLDLSAMTVTGETLGELLARPPADPVDRTVIRAFGDPDRAGGRPRRPVRLARSRRRHPQALGRRQAPSRARGPRRRLLLARRSRGAHRPARSRRDARTISSSSRMPARRARRRCPRPGICRSRRSSRAPGSRTWCASPTPACRAPPMAPSSST